MKLCTLCFDPSFALICIWPGILLHLFTILPNPIPHLCGIYYILMRNCALLCKFVEMGEVVPGGGGRWVKTKCRWWREVEMVVEGVVGGRVKTKTQHKDNGFEPIHWKYECQGLHLSES